jgi:predicted HTH domain antitoxin
MEQILTVSYPKQLARSLKMQDNEFVIEMRKLAIVKLYEIGKISSSVAANILGLNRVDFVALLRDYEVSFFAYTSESDILNDWKNA